MKEIIKQIIIEKRKASEDSILFINPDIYNKIESANMIVEWEECYPGAILQHSNICGLTFFIDPNEEFFSIVSLPEAIERLHILMK